MITTRRWHLMGTLGLGLLGLVGCQTWVPSAGMTLPSGHYLEHPPQYFAPSPAFPLSRELATMEQQSAQAQPGVPAAAPQPGPGVPPPG